MEKINLIPVKTSTCKQNPNLLQEKFTWLFLTLWRS